MSTLKTCTGLLSGEPLAAKSSITASQHRSSQVMTTSTTPASVPVLPLLWRCCSLTRGVPTGQSCHLSGPHFTCRFRSNMGSNPLALYSRGSLLSNSLYMLSYEVTLKLYTLGCVIDGPGNRTSEPVPKERH